MMVMMMTIIIIIIKNVLINLPLSITLRVSFVYFYIPTYRSKMINLNFLYYYFLLFIFFLNNNNSSSVIIIIIMRENQITFMASVEE